MKFREFTAETSEDGTEVVRVRARISDNMDREDQSEWIEFQVNIDRPTSLGGSLLCKRAMEIAADKLKNLAADFGNMGITIKAKE